jgi:hypothetical protein
LLRATHTHKRTHTSTHAHTRARSARTHSSSLSLPLSLSASLVLEAHFYSDHSFFTMLLSGGFQSSPYAAGLQSPLLVFDASSFHFILLLCVCVRPSYFCSFLFLPKTIFTSMQAPTLKCHQSGGNSQYGRRSTKQQSKSDCRSYFSFPSRLPHTFCSLILLRALVPKVKRTQLKAQHSVLVRPLKIHVHYTASLNKYRDDSTI